MSVPAYKREENKMTIITKSQELVSEVIRLSKNEKVLPKKTEKILKDAFLKDAMSFYKEVSAANEMNLNDSDESQLRKRLQIQAKLNLTNLVSQINLNIDYLGTPYAKYKNLLEYIQDVKRLLYAWMKSDKENKKI